MTIARMEADSASLQVQLARKLAHSRIWETETLAELAQLGIPWADAFEIMRDRSVENMSLEQYRAARRIVNLRTQLRDRLLMRDVSGEPAVLGRGDDPVVETSVRVSQGEDVFEALARMAEDLAENGEPPIVLPGQYDRGFWDAVHAAQSGSPEALRRYLRELPKQTTETVEPVIARGHHAGAR